MTLLVPSETSCNLPLVGGNFNYSRAVVFDLDDTIFEGEYEIFCHVMKLLPKHISFQWKNRMSQDDPVIGEYLKAVLADASFMKSTPLIKDRIHFGVLLEELQKEHSDTLFMFCTHRGYTKKAREYTEFLFKDNCIHNFPGVYLDYNLVPCKKTFLDQYLGIPYILFDDHPKYNGGEKEKVENIFLMDKPWNKAESSYTRLHSFFDIVSVIDNFLK